MESSNIAVVTAVGTMMNNATASSNPNSTDMNIMPPKPLPSDVSTSSAMTSADLPIILNPSAMDITRFTMPRKKGTFRYHGFFSGRRYVSSRMRPISSLTDNAMERSPRIITPSITA